MKIGNDIYYVGVNDHQVDLFEGQYVVPNGMSYNSYVIMDEKIAVMDTVDANFKDEWLENVAKVLDGAKPDYLVVQHMEPDHAANIENFMKAYPDTTVVANTKTFTMMGNFFRNLNLDGKKLVVANGDSLTLGKHVLTFVFAPMVHWPEVMVTYDSTDKVLFSADGFGKFGALDVEEDWDCEARRYYIGIVGKYGAQVQKLLKAAATLDIQTICPLHGPILTENLGHYIEKYDIWSSYKVESEGVVIAYTSVYGNTKKAVELLAQKLEEKGCPKVTVFDLARDDMAEAVEDAFRYGKLVLATITYNGDIYGVPYTPNTWFMYYDKSVFSEDDVKSLDTMLKKGKVSFPFDNGWYLASFYAANGCTIFGDGTDASKGYDFGGDNAVAVTKYIVKLFNNKNFVMDNNEGSLGLAGLKDGSVNAYFNGNWNYDAVVKNLGEENVGVAALPTIKVDGKKCQLKAFLGSKAVGVNSNCKNQEVAVKLAAYLGSEDAQLKHFELRKQAPVNTNLVSNEEVSKDAVASALANVAANCSIAQPIIPMQAYWDAATPFGDAFVHGAEGQITADNAKEKTEAFNEQLNSSLTE